MSEEKIVAPARQIHDQLTERRGESFPCDGRGTCGKCKVRLAEKLKEEYKESEQKFLTDIEKTQNIRLACYLESDEPVEAFRVESAKLNSGNQILNAGQIAHFDIDPVLAFDHLDCGGLAVSFNDQIIDQVDQVTDLLALVVDIGTTTIIVSLIDVNKREILASKSGLNPQRKYGHDVMTRISSIQDYPNRLQEMQRAIIDQIEEFALDLCQEFNYDGHNIFGIFVAANAVMNHILMGTSPVALGLAPYQLEFKDTQVRDFQSLGLREAFGKGKMASLANISAFVGGDILAGIYASGIHRTEDIELLVDIGTNGEIILNKQGQLYSTSAAAGPALEGMMISCGVRAQSGAIEEALLNRRNLRLKRIDHQRSIGICGSGILALIREFLKVGLILPRGNIAKARQVEEKYHKFFTSDFKGLWVDKRENIYITQQDIRQVQLAKGAILSGIQALLQESNTDPKEVSKCFIAGQFGSYLSPKSLTKVGLIPMELEDKIEYIGNSSHSGAYMACMNKDLFISGNDIVSNIHLELSLLNNFDRLFAKATHFPKVTMD